MKATAFQVLMAGLNVVLAIDPLEKIAPYAGAHWSTHGTGKRKSIVSYVGSGPWSLRMPALLGHGKDSCCDN